MIKFIEKENFVTITDENNNPYCCWQECYSDMGIREIRPEIEKIIWNEE